MFIGSDDSDKPESVTVEDIMDDKPSKIKTIDSFKIHTFQIYFEKKKLRNISQVKLKIFHLLPSFFEALFGSDPNPDDPDVIDESSRMPPTRPGSAVTLEVAGITPAVRGIVVPGKLDNGVLSTPTYSLPKSSCDAIFLLFELDVGLNRNKRIKYYFFAIANCGQISHLVRINQKLKKYIHFKKRITTEHVHFNCETQL